MSKPYAIAILGAGSWGTALALHLARNGVAVCLWDHMTELLQAMKTQRCNQRYLPNFTFPKTLHIELRLEDALEKSRDVLIAVPSRAFDAVLQACLPHIAISTRILWVTKGIDPERHVLLHTLIERHFTKAMPFAVLSGPSFAGEVAAELPTAVTLASNNDDFQQEMAALFASPLFRIHMTSDYIGVQIGGSVKNVLAIAVGISDGLGYGANFRAALITMGLNEMIRLGLAMGARLETLIGLSGMGDLVLTCTDSQSRNRRFGLALGQGIAAEDAEKQIVQSIEGKGNAAQFYWLSQQYLIDMPIVTTVFDILSGKITAKAGFSILLHKI